MNKQRPFEHLGRDRYGSNREKGRKNQNPHKTGQVDDEIKSIIDKINSFSKLELVLTSAEVNLPDGLADRVAKNLRKSRRLNTSQLYKYFAMVKEVESYYDTDFNKALEHLYSVVPLVAYSAGRNICPRSFYYLLKACINPNKIKDKNDIKALISFLEATVAYFKFWEFKEGGKS